MFNLNINSYNLEELKSLFHVEPSGLINSVSLHEILEERYQNMLTSINQNPHMNTMQKKESNEFLFQAKLKLENLLAPQINNTVFQDSKKIESIPWNVAGNSSNPSTKKIARLVSVDSKYRDNIENEPIETNNFQVSFASRFNKVESMEILEFTAPTSIKVIGDSMKNNYFHVEIGEDITKITIDDFYRIERNILSSQDNRKFINRLNDKLNDEFGNNDIIFSFKNADAITPGDDIDTMMDRTLVVNNSTGKNVKFYFNKTPDGNHDPNCVLFKTLGHILGFRHFEVTISNGGTYETPASLDLISFKYAYLIVDDFQSNGETNIVAENVYSVPCAQNMKFGGNILAKVNYKNDANYNVTNRVITTPRIYYGNVDIAKLRVTLVNEFGDLIDTHGAEWAFTLKFNCSYQ